MKSFIQKYRISKYRCFVSGLLYALISTTALILCLNYLNTQAEEQLKISVTFAIAISSLLMGIVSMFSKQEKPSGKILE